MERKNNPPQKQGQNVKPYDPEQPDEQEKLKVKSFQTDNKRKDSAQQNNTNVSKKSHRSSSRKEQEKKPGRVEPSENLKKSLKQVQSPSKVNQLSEKKASQNTVISKASNNSCPSPRSPVFYEQTYYISGMKENYLLLLSDKNQILEFPIGMFVQNSGPRQSFPSPQLQEGIMIGQPIKIKLEWDSVQQRKDEAKFNTLQRNLHRQYGNEQKERKI